MYEWSYALSSASYAPRTAPILLTGDICSNMARAAKMGYQALEVHTRETARLPFEQIRSVSEYSGVKVAMIITGRLNTEGQVSLIDDRSYVTDAAIAGLERYIEMAARLGAGLVIGWIRGKIPDVSRREAYLERLGENMSHVARMAESAKVALCLEVINHYETNILNTASETLSFLDRYEIPNCSVHLDTYHMNMSELDPCAAIRLCGKRLGYFHLADNTRWYPGSGQIDFLSILQSLRDVGYDGYLSVECLPEPDADTAAQNAIRYLREQTNKIPIEQLDKERHPL
ncbi:hypothetical protein FACS1894204_05010 [Synergistales bacterium]|nr:hypothetical protein FACS1894204_05010 [Synergistales bacterium]